MNSTIPRCPLVPLLLLLCACSRGSGSTRIPPDPAPVSTDLARSELAPGVVVRILSAASDSKGFAQVGEHIVVRFALDKADGSPWGLSEMAFSSVLVSGTTSRYQRVIAESNDVVSRSSKNPDGSYSLTLAPLPASYLPPLNDSLAFGPENGELTGQPLRTGTYTVGLGFAWMYTVGGTPHTDAGEDTFDFLLGGGAVHAARAVVAQENCDLCHVDLQAHDGLRRNVTMCLLCHTAGSEDLNDPAVGGGTPGVTVDSRVLFHRIHNGAHLPSVVGIGVGPSGQLDYSVASTPYRVADAQGNLRDFSNVGYPVFPNRAHAMPKDLNHGLLQPSERAQEERVRTGVIACFTCHGDPDGAGPLPAPEHGHLILSQPSREACGACHDDIDWTRPYQVNGEVMPPQATNSDCLSCHPDTGSPKAVEDAHLHPLRDPALNSGVNTFLLSVTESGAHNNDGTVDSGEQLAISFEVRDDAGLSVPKSRIDEVRVTVSGPTSNSQLLLDIVVPEAALTNPQPFTIDLPELVALEYLGDSAAGSGEFFATARAPHLDVSGAETTVFVRTVAPGASTTLLSGALAPQNFVDVADATSFDRGDHIVLDEGLAGFEEYLLIQFIEGDRLWFSSPFTPAFAPGLRADHALGASVQAGVLELKTAGLDYSLDPLTGVLVELVEFGSGSAVVASYTTPFVLPLTFGAALNDSPDLDERVGKWTGKPIVDGTYTVAVSAHRQIDVVRLFESNLYEVTSRPATADFLVGVAAALEPYDLIQSGAACNDCHQDLTFHDGVYRGFKTCLACHGTSGTEDRPRYVAASAPDTPGRSANFRSLLHGIHMGKLLDDPASFQVVGAGPAPYPDNFQVRTWKHLLFPPQPGAASRCAKCHGAGNAAWLTPADRNHPSAQGASVTEWQIVCAACHDSQAAIAHIDSNTGLSGAEACAVCHGPTKPYAVDVMHIAR